MNWYIVSKLIKKSKIVKEDGQWCVKAKSGRNMGCYDTKKEAVERLRQVEYYSKNDE